MKIFKQVILTILILSVPAYAAQILLKSISTTNPNRLLKSTTTGVVDEAAAITASRALVSDANGIPVNSSVTTTELGYLSGVTSNVQDQLDAVGGGGANPALSNLASVAINTSLLTFDGTQNLGDGSGHNFNNAYIAALFDNSGVGAFTVYSRVMNDTSNVQSADFDQRILSDGSGNSVARWSNTNLFEALSSFKLTNLTATTVPYLNSSKVLTSSAVTPTELGYLSGVTSNIQTQINSISGTPGGLNTQVQFNDSSAFGGDAGLVYNKTTDVLTSGGVIVSGATASTVPYLNASKQITSSSVTPTELGYLSGATSNLQSQISALGSGGIVGTTGSTDNALLRADGTGGNTAQSSSVSLADNGAMVDQLTSNGVALTLKAYTGGQSSNVFEMYRSNGDLCMTMDNNGSMITCGALTANTLRGFNGGIMEFGSPSASAYLFDVRGTAVNQAWLAMMRFQTPKATDKGIVVQAGFSGQTANLQEWQDETETPLSWIGPNGAPGGLLSQANKSLSNLTTTAINQDLIGDTGAGWIFQSKNSTSSQNVSLKSGNASAGNSGSLFFTTGTASGTRGGIQIDAASMSTNANITLAGITNADIAISDSTSDPAWDLFGNLTTPSGITNTGGIRARGTAVSSLAFFTASDSNANSTKTNDLLIETGNKTAGTGDSGSIKMQTGTSLGGVSGGYNLVIGAGTGHENSGGFLFTGGNVNGDGSHSPKSGDVEFDTGFGVGTNDSSGSFVAYTGDADAQTGAITLNTGSSTEFSSGGLYSTTGQGSSSSGGFQFTSGDASAGASGGFVYYGGSGTSASGDISFTTGSASAGDTGNFLFTAGTATGGNRGKVLLSSSALQINESVFMSTKDSSADKPTIAADGHLGSTGSVSVDNSASDVGGKFTLTPGGTSIALGLQATITLHGTCLNNPTVVLYPANTNAATAEATLGIYADGASANTFTVSSNTALLTGTAYIFSYVVICH